MDSRHGPSGAVFFSGLQGTAPAEGAYTQAMFRVFLGNTRQPETRKMTVFSAVDVEQHCSHLAKAWTHHYSMNESRASQQNVLTLVGPIPELTTQPALTPEQRSAIQRVFFATFTECRFKAT